MKYGFDRVTRKSRTELDKMRAAGRLTGEILRDLRKMVAPGVTTLDLDRFAEQRAKDAGAIPAFKGVPSPHGGPYKHTICASINEQVVHGIPSNRELKEGDVVGIDFGVVLNGYVGDSAFTIPVGQIPDHVKQLLKATEGSLHAAIDKMRAGNTLNDVGGAVEDFVRPYGFGIVREYCGHGVGRRMHEPPQVPNYRSSGRHAHMVLREGLVLAIEPMINLGTHETKTAEDGWTVITADKKYSAHFEHTIAVTEEGPEILTYVEGEPLLTTAAL
jgi:methionyl aminopeptidase